MALFFHSSGFKDRNRFIKRAKKTVSFLSVTLGERTLREYKNLEKAKDYIKKSFLESNFTLEEDSYLVEGKQVSNIIAEKKGKHFPEKIILVGAHYDTVENSPGADDNATAIAALLEMAAFFSKIEVSRTIRFVAFTLEEPPFFGSKQMGSRRYASACRSKGEQIEFMLCLEMMGYGHKKHPQNFPPILDKKEVPSSGDFLTVVSLPVMSKYVYLWEKIYNQVSKQKIFPMIAPASVPGIDLSDHTSFIKNNYPAVMICDTGFYRNKNYHTPSDTYDTLNFKFLAQNIYNSILTLKKIINLNQILEN